MPKKNHIEIFTIFILAVLASSFFSSKLYFFIKTLPTGIEFNTWTYNLLVLLILLVFLILDSFLFRRKLKEYGVSKLTWNHTKIALFMFAFFFIFSVLTRILLPEFDFWYARALGITTLSAVKSMILFLPLSILVQNIMIRMLLQPKLEHLYGSKIAIIMVALIMAIIHIPFHSTNINLLFHLSIFLTVFVYSIFIGLLFSYTKNIFPVILVHLLVDFVGVLQIFFHATNLFYEAVLWSIWGIIFFVFSSRTVKTIKEMTKTAWKNKTIGISDMIYLLIILLVSVIVSYIQ